MRRAPTVIDQIDSIVDDVVKATTAHIDMVLNAIAEDGRAFGEEKLSPDEKLMHYIRDLRGNPVAWEEWVRSNVEVINSALMNVPNSETVIARVAPYDIAERYALEYSREQEAAIANAIKSEVTDGRPI